jgi:hypothetical protein
VTKRFGQLLARVGAATGRELRLVDDRERQLLDVLFPTPTAAAHTGKAELRPEDTPRGLDHKEAI